MPSAPSATPEAGGVTVVKPEPGEVVDLLTATKAELKGEAKEEADTTAAAPPCAVATQSALSASLMKPSNRLAALSGCNG